MIAPRPFFLLIGRASVFWMSALGLFIVSLAALGFAQPDSRLAWYLDGVFVAAFAYPIFAGSLVGSVIQEFQHTSFAAFLPGVRYRIASGFLITALAVNVVVVGAIALSSSTPQNLPLLFVVGVAGFCLGGIFLDPLSVRVTTLNVVVVLFVVVSSREVARIAGDHPWWTVVVAAGIAVVCLLRLFARSTFRRKPFRATSPIPGRFSLEKSQQYKSRQRVQDGPRKTGWRAGYLGSGSWHWVRAALHEVHGHRGWKSLSRTFGRAWGMGILVLLYAWVDKGEMSFGEALAKSINDALFRSPHQPQFGEKGGPFAVVMIMIAAAGIVTALFAPVALNDGMVYPLSRRQRARVLFRGGLVDGAIFLFIVGPCLLVVGHLTGWFVGYEMRFDFMPFFFRVLLVTLILLPLAHWGRLRLQAATRRKSENTQVAVVFAIIGFVLAVGLGTLVSPRLFVSPLAELAALAVALLASQLIYRHNLTSYYRAADLA